MFMNANDRILHSADASLQEENRPISLCGAVLGHQAHVCAFFSTPDERFRLLLPFIKDGLARGDKVVHTVDPAQRKEELHRLAAHAITPLPPTPSGPFA